MSAKKRSTSKPSPTRSTEPRPRSPRPSQSATPVARSWLRFGSLVALGLAPVLALAGWAHLPEPALTAPFVFEVPVGEPRSQTVGRLAAAGVVRSGALFDGYLSLTGVPIAPGEHLLVGGLSPRDLSRALGRLPVRPLVRVSLPEGLNHRQIGERLEKKGVCTRRALAEAVRDKALLASLEVGHETAEGWLFPATYDLPLDAEASAVVRQLVRELRKRLARWDEEHPGVRQRALSARGWGERELLTLASIVEKETGVAEERPLVASVYFGRLDDPTFLPRGMLQADPTAAYGCLTEPAAAPSCAGFNGRVTPEQLKDAANRYNSYKHAGLPPGPIGNPGLGSIAAVLEPPRTGYLFFVARGDGGHAFSRTFAEHQQRVEELRQQRAKTP